MSSTAASVSHDASASIPVPDIIDADISKCPWCGEEQLDSQLRNYNECSKCHHRFPNATWLFESWDLTTARPRGNFRRPQEGFTTAIFALYLLDPEGDKRFPIRLIDTSYKCHRIDWLDLHGLSLHNLGIEISPRPDLLIEGKTWIENKPWADESGPGQLMRYRKEAQESGCDFFVLISCGNDKPDLWQLLASSGIRVILWEEVLCRMDHAKFALSLAPERTLKPYYETFLPTSTAG